RSLIAGTTVHLAAIALVFSFPKTPGAARYPKTGRRIMFFRRKQVRWSNASRWHRRVLWIFICVAALLALWGGLVTQAADGDLDRSFGNGGKVMVQIAAQKRD